MALDAGPQSSVDMIVAQNIENEPNCNTYLSKVDFQVHNSYRVFSLAKKRSLHGSTSSLSGGELSSPNTESHTSEDFPRSDFVRFRSDTSINNLIEGSPRYSLAESKNFVEALDLVDNGRIVRQITAYRRNLSRCCYDANCPFHSPYRATKSLENLKVLEQSRSKDYLWNRKYRRFSDDEHYESIWDKCVKWSKHRMGLTIPKTTYQMESRRNSYQKFFCGNHQAQIRTPKKPWLNFSMIFCCFNGENSSDEREPLLQRYNARSYSIF